MPTTENSSMWPQCHTANHHLAVWHGCQYSRSPFWPFGLPTRSRSNGQSVRYLYIDNVVDTHHSLAKCIVDVFYCVVIIQVFRLPYVNKHIVSYRINCYFVIVFDTHLHISNVQLIWLMNSLWHMFAEIVELSDKTCCWSTLWCMGFLYWALLIHTDVCCRHC